MFMMGSKVYLYSSMGDDILRDTDANSMLIMCNHRTRVDWMYAGWCYGALSQLNAKLRIVLKDPLRQVPIFGWGMQIMMYVFLSRSRDKRDRDLSYVHDMLTYLLNMERAICLFIFPEGTDLSDSNKLISHKCKSIRRH
jgi:lysocardiolipin and lysophospholipid acyltransferase